MRSHSLPRSIMVFGGAALAALLVVPSCKTEQPAAPTTCCDQPKVPPGIAAFIVVRDEVSGPSDGQDVKIHVALKQKTKRDDIYSALQFLYRYAMTRNTFEPVGFLGAFYNTEGDAQTGGNPVAKIWRDRGDKGPKCENAIGLEFPEEVQKAFLHSLNRGEVEDLNDSCHLNEKKKETHIDDKFTHKPTMKVDEARHAVEVSYPYLETGKDEYAKTLSFNSAMTYWAEFLTAMFGNEPLRWSDSLAGDARLRFTLNTLTRTRFVAADGTLDFKTKDGSTEPPPGLYRWFEAPDRRTAGVPIAFGHWSTLGYFSNVDVTSLDTGCVWGGSLSALRIDAPGETPVQVHCATNGLRTSPRTE